MKSMSGCPFVASVGALLDCHNALFVEIEYADGGDLFKAISPNSDALDEMVARRYVRDICSGLAYVHSKGVVHCDLKPENVLLQGGRAKLADFGLATKRGVQRQKPAVGTAPYMAPELLMRSQHQYTVEPSHDVWGFGIILYAVFFADLPWECAMFQEADYAKFLKHRRTLNLCVCCHLSHRARHRFLLLCAHGGHRVCNREEGGWKAGQ
jgi:serine/threonine protein kinase